jgi:hypothetical protein
MNRMQFEPADVLGAQVAYLLYDRNLFGQKRTLIGVYRNATETLKSIGLLWPAQAKQRLFAAYQDGRLREIGHVNELIRHVPEPQAAGTI